MKFSVISRTLKQDIARFLLSGGFNTGLTYGIYLLLILVLDYKLSYTISYVFGILLAYLLNRYFVFKSHKGIKSVLSLPVIYGAQYCVGLFLIWIWIDKLNLSPQIAPLVAIAITLPITFALSKLAFSNRALHK
ncbi:GtrA family protein [Pseudomonas sp. JDS28PS106]|uniref:GtrA family protein n=1 Tax=Pseudomonas sp. JDS28PS106 TaxID=2497235 RepID=UPI002FD2A879